MDNYKEILVDRRGDVFGSNMTTESLVDEVKIGSCYKFTCNGLEEVIDNSWRCIINKKWDDSIGEIKNGEANILGGSRYLVLDDNLNIPVASSNYLWYYGVKIMNIGDVVCFETDCDKLPLFMMDIGCNYVDEYIMKKGGGVYLEKHERPHFYIRCNTYSSGYLCFGRECNEGISISAFEVPEGKALYVPNNVIHNDCFLTGKYKVIYSKTDKYETLVLVDKKKTPINLRIYKKN